MFKLKYRKTMFAAVCLAVVCFLFIADHYQDAELKAAVLESIDKDRARDFRNIYWGMTRAQVEVSEAWGPDELAPDTYDGKIFGKKCSLYYLYVDGGPIKDQPLRTGMYRFDGLEKSEAFALKVQIASILADKYGVYRISSKEPTWYWNTRDGKTSISLSHNYDKYEALRGNSGKYGVSIHYSSTELPVRDPVHFAKKEKENKAKKQAELAQRREAARQKYEAAASNF